MIKFSYQAYVNDEKDPFVTAKTVGDLVKKAAKMGPMKGNIKATKTTHFSDPGSAIQVEAV
jgi:hypothetical protein